MKNRLLFIFVFALVLFFVNTLSSIAVSYLSSNNIGYISNNNSLKADNVQEAIDELYDKYQYSTEHIDYTVVSSIVFDVDYYAFNNWNGAREDKNVYYLDIYGANKAGFRTSPMWSTSNALFDIILVSADCTSAGVGTFVFDVVTNETNPWTGPSSVTSKLTVEVNDIGNVKASSYVFHNDHPDNGSAILTIYSISTKIKTIHDASKINFNQIKSISLSTNFKATNPWNGIRETDEVYYIDIKGENRAEFREVPSWTSSNAAFSIELIDVKCDSKGIGTYTLSVTNSETNPWSGGSTQTNEFVITVNKDGEITSSGVVTNGISTGGTGYAGTTFKDISLILS